MSIYRILCLLSLIGLMSSCGNDDNPSPGGCAPGYEGPNCEEQIRPLRILIHKVELIKYAGNEIVHDPDNSGADLFIEIKDSRTGPYPVVVGTSSTIYDVPIGPLASPLVWTFDTPVRLGSSSEFYPTIHLYDKDDEELWDYSFYGIGKPIYSSTGGFPSTYLFAPGNSLEDTATAFRLHLSYVWE